MELQANVSGVPYIDQFLGVWSMYPPALSAFKTLAEQINVNVHLSNSPHAPIATLHGDDIRSATDRDGIARINLHGTLLKHSSSFSANTSTVETRRLVRAAKNDPDVSGVLFHVDSPGGTVAGTDDLASDIRALQAVKPTVAFIEDLGASAAYWLAAQAGTVFSNSQAIIGSIGVLTVVHDLSRLAEAENITVHVIKAGEMKGAGVPGTEITESQIAEWQKLIDAFYGDFISAVTEGRNLPRARVTELADGRVHVGQAAADLGLTDGVRSLDEAMAELVALTKRGASSKGKPKMSEDHVEDVAAQAATTSELKTAMPNADPGFLFEQVDSGATLAQARESYADAREAKLSEGEAALEEAKKTAEKEADKPLKVPGQKPLGDGGEADVDESSFDELVADMMEAHDCDRRVASRYVLKSFSKDEREAYLESLPAGGSRD